MEKTRVLNHSPSLFDAPGTEAPLRNKFQYLFNHFEFVILNKCAHLLVLDTESSKLTHSAFQNLTFAD